MITVNLFDTSFKHLETSDGIYSITDNRNPLNWKYVRDKKIHDGITIFTDSFICNSELVNSVQSKYKVAWMIEPREINSKVYDNIEQVLNIFDIIITYDAELCDRYPDKIKYYPFGGSWILEDNFGIYEKSKKLNMLYSHKQITEGHRLRHQVSTLIHDIDLYGSGCGKPFEYKEEVLAPYRFSIVIENVKRKHYFSEKLLDAMAVGTIPVYWGCPEIGKFFNEDGIITFDTLDDLQNIIPTLTDELYESKVSAIQQNLDKLKEYYCQEDWIYNNIFCNLDLEDTYDVIDYQPTDPRTKVEGHIQEYWLNLFFNNGGDVKHLYAHDLNENSIVFDMGAYEGEFYTAIVNKYNCNVYAFEPVSEFYNNCKKSLPPKVILNPFALGTKEVEFEIGLAGNSSSQFINGKKVKCLKRKFSNYIRENGVTKIDLIKINIEGGEYELLNDILNSGFIENVDSLLIQFHYLADNPISARESIINRLKLTHEPVYVYPFVWELWKLKK